MVGTRISDICAVAGVAYTADVERLITQAQRLGRIPDDLDPRLAATGVVAAVSSFSQAARSGWVSGSTSGLACFVGGWVVRALGAESTAHHG